MRNFSAFRARRSIPPTSATCIGVVQKKARFVGREKRFPVQSEQLSKQIDVSRDYESQTAPRATRISWETPINQMPKRENARKGTTRPPNPRIWCLTLTRSEP
jgi:hypothetical protein